MTNVYDISQKSLTTYFLYHGSLPIFENDEIHYSICIDDLETALEWAENAIECQFLAYKE